MVPKEKGQPLPESRPRWYERRGVWTAFFAITLLVLVILALVYSFAPSVPRTAQ